MEAPTEAMGEPMEVPTEAMGELAKTAAMEALTEVPAMEVVLMEALTDAAMEQQ